MSIPNDAWLVVIDHQRIFADPASQWCAPRFAQTAPVVARLAAHCGERVVLTRWLPGHNREGSWGAYFQQWQFADRPDDDPYFELVETAAGLTRRPPVDVSTFGKWGPELAAITGEHPHLVLAGVATDCCVISTALAAADAGCTVTVVSDACAGSSDENHAAALQVMGLYAPQITVVDSATLLS
ncbi:MULTISPECIES: cysteine hydrolase family protein [unclassified Luteococcus]|uniref:cysteine hydrolase family protein n=1 Tax=unclassified Luteococcus TaxID=2639923 RepID=UPI00313DBF47